MVASCCVNPPSPSRALASTRPALKAGVRRLGMLTAGLRPLPDFLVIGAKRGGSTSFYFDLLAHPSVIRLFPPPIPGLKSDATKGIHYFDSNFDKSAQWYRSYMPTSATRRLVSMRTGTQAVVGEASPYYLFHPDAARRAHQVVPDAKVIVLLRDPVDRTYSHWKERRRSHAEELDFASAVRAEPGRLAGEREKLLADPHYYSYPWEQQSYVAQSKYGAALRPWVEMFGRDHVYAAASEEYYADPLAVLSDVDEFLGLPRRDHANAELRNAAVGPDLDVGLRHELEQQFVDDKQELVSLLGHRFPWS